jgi:GT2 family glycosyltransferase
LSSPETETDSAATKSGPGLSAETYMSVEDSRVLAVVLNWNRLDFSLRCARHVLDQINSRADVLIVDNGSTDGSAERVLASGLQVKLLRLRTNQGFAGGMNAGIRHALENGYKYVWLLNNDAFAAPDCLHALVTRLRRDPRLAMVTPRILSPTGSEQHAGGVVDAVTAQLATRSSAEMESPRGEGYWLTGTAPLLRMEAIRDVGPFEPAFFAYWEDVDMSTRLTRRGATIAAVPEAVVTHVGTASGGGFDSPFVWFLMTRNQWLYLARHTDHHSHTAHWLEFVSTVLEWTSVDEWNGMKMTRPIVIAMLAGLSAARRGRFGAPPANMSPAAVERFLNWQTRYSIRLLRAAARLVRWRRALIARVTVSGRYI